MAPRTRAEIQAELDALDAAAAEDEAEFEYEIGRGDNYARVSSKSKAGRKIAGFFKESFGIDLDDEPVQDEPEEPVKPEKPAGRGQAKAGGGNVRAFTSGTRRTG